MRFLRNLTQIKKYMYNQHYITRFEHKKFIQNLRKNNTKIYFCVSIKKQILGNINFKFKNKNTVEFGFYSNPYALTSGLGRILEQVCIYYAFEILQAKMLYLEAFKENLQVINLHKKFGFKELQSEDNKIVKMTLRKA